MIAKVEVPGKTAWHARTEHHEPGGQQGATRLARLGECQNKEQEEGQKTYQRPNL